MDIVEGEVDDVLDAVAQVARAGLIMLLGGSRAAPKPRLAR
jgi:hypothetical protein